MTLPIQTENAVFTNQVKLSASDIMKQAGMTAHDYMLKAIESIDKQMGSGYSKAHPELVASFMQTCALDYMTVILSQTLQEAATDIGNAIEQAADDD